MSRAAAALGEAIRRSQNVYQRQWLNTARTAPYIAHLGGRQIRKDTTWAAHLVGGCVSTPHKQWQAFNCTATKAQEFLDDCRKWNTLFGWSCSRAGVSYPRLVVDNATTLKWDNGAVIRSRAPTLRNVVGVRDSVLLNEAGVIPHAQQLYEALYPIVRESRSQGRDAQFVIISNACRKGQWWDEFWSGRVMGGNSSWTPIQTTWEDAKRGQGWTDAQIAEERTQILRDISTPAFLQWYMCVFRSASEGFFESELLDKASVDRPGPFDTSPQVVGYDVGLKVHPCAYAPLLLPSPDLPAHIMKTTAKWGREYADQRRDILALTRARPTRGVAMDATGAGTQAEELRKLLSKHGVPLDEVSMGLGTAVEMFTTMKDAYQAGDLTYDRGDIDFRIELEGLVLGTTPRGHETVKIPEERIDVDGERKTRHGDRAVAGGLAVRTWRRRGKAVVPFHSPNSPRLMRQPVGR